MEQRKKWSRISITLFVLAVVLAVSNRFLPKPAEEVEAIVETYLLTRTLFMLGAGVLAVFGLLVIVKYLRCPHCGAFGIKQIKICGNCGKDMDEPVVALSEEVAAETDAVEEALPANASSSES